MSSQENIASSFRDPSGYVFKKDGGVYRGISKSFKENFDLFISTGLYKKLIDKKLLVSHKEQKETNSFYKIIKPQLIPFISYPYEWCFSQYKDAALLTLQIAKMALDHSMVLKDASAYNIQFVGAKPIFIDTLSFEKYEENKPWVAYKQFCQHFLAPLVLASHKDVRLMLLMRDFIDGIPLDLADKIIPTIIKLNPSIYLHISMHSRMQNKYADDVKTKTPSRKEIFSKSSFYALLQNLESTIGGLKFKLPATEWGEYYDNTNYNEKSAKLKKKTVLSMVKQINPKSVWDMGANDGTYSRLAEKSNIPTVAFDIDPVAVEKGYLQAKENNENLLFLLQDITNPSPGIGFDNTEREPIKERGSADLILALAIIHHLSISNNLPLEKTAQYFASLGKNLVIEFVPKSDSKVQKLLATREDIFPDYTEEGFEKEYSKFFKLIKKVKINHSKRTLYLFKKK